MSRPLINGDRRAEQRRQSAILDRLEVRYRARIRRTLTEAMLQAAEFYELTGTVPPMQDLPDKMQRVYADMAAASIRAFGARVLEAGVSKASPYVTETGQIRFATARLDAPSWDVKGLREFLARIAQEYIAQEMVRRRIVQITETTRQQIVTAVNAGYADGLGQAGIGARIRASVPSFAAFRANRIARTETHGAANYGAQQAAVETGLRLQKEWVSAEDERTRIAHRLADGQIVDRDEPFQVGGEALQFPGDPEGRAENVVNCRCAVVHIVVD